MSYMTEKCPYTGEEFYHFVGLTPEQEKERERERENNRWFNKTTLKWLGKQTALNAKAVGYTDIKDVRRDMQSDLKNTMTNLLKGFSAKNLMSRSHALKILDKLGIDVPPKAQVTCKCCGQNIPQIDAIDQAVAEAREFCAQQIRNA